MITRKPERTSSLVVGDHHADPSRRRPGSGASASSSSCQRTRSAADALADASQPHRSRGLELFGDTRAGHPADHLGGQDLARPGSVAEPGGDDHRRAVEVLALR